MRLPPAHNQVFPKPWASYLHIRGSAMEICQGDFKFTKKRNSAFKMQSTFFWKIVLGVGELERNIVLLNKLAGSSTGGGLLAQVEPHLLDRRTELQGFGGGRHLQPASKVTRALPPFMESAITDIYRRLVVSQASHCISTSEHSWLSRLPQ